MFIYHCSTAVAAALHEQVPKAVAAAAAATAAAAMLLI